MSTYTVTVEHEGFSADWLDNFIVLATDEADAKEVGERFVRYAHPTHYVKWSEAYLLTGESRVVGRLINTDEE